MAWGRRRSGTPSVNCRGAEPKNRGQCVVSWPGSGCLQGPGGASLWGPAGAVLVCGHDACLPNLCRSGAQQNGRCRDCACRRTMGQRMTRHGVQRYHHNLPGRTTVLQMWYFPQAPNNGRRAQYLSTKSMQFAKMDCPRLKTEVPSSKPQCPIQILFANNDVK